MSSGRQMRLTTRWALNATGLVAAMVIWQVASLLVHNPFFPTFTTALSSAASLLTGGDLSSDVVPSVVRVLIGFVLAGLLGTLVGAALGSARMLAEYITPVLDFIRATPFPLLLPLAIVIFGLGNTTIISLIVLGAVWPVLLNTFDAARAIDPLQRDVARVCQMSRRQEFLRITLPAVAPAIVSGLRVALGLCLAVLVVAEMLGASSGLGHLIVSAEQDFDTPTTYAGVLVLGALGWIMDGLFLMLERRLLRWLPKA
jgi:ABC-type nitrate/sulfonate/bicarbonate transport system permease component